MTNTPDRGESGQTNKSTHLLQALFDSFPGGLTVFGADLRLEMANDCFYRMFEISKQEFPTGTSMSLVVRHLAGKGYFGSGDPDKIVAKHFSEVRKGKRFCGERYCPDGRVFEVNGFPLCEGGYVTTTLDVTEKRLGQERLRQSQQRFRDMARISSDWFWETDEDHRFCFVSQRFAEKTNIPVSRLIGKTRQEVCVQSETDWSSYQDDLDARRPIRNCSYAIVDPDEQVHYYSIDGMPFFDADGTFLGYRGTGRDTTVETKAKAELDRKNRELEDLNDQLITEQTRLDSIYRNTPAMLHSIMADGEIIDVSDYWCRTMGYARDEVVGRSIYDFMDEESGGRMRQHYESQLFSGKRIDNVDYVYVRKDDSLMDVRLSAIAAPGTRGGQLHSFSVAFDISRQKTAEYELEAHRDQLQTMVDQATQDLNAQAVELRAALNKEKEVNEQQRQFVAMASHEFRTPLAIIDSAAQRLQRSSANLTPEKLEDRINKIRSAVTRMTRLMESTLSAARLDEGKINIEIAPCNIERIIVEACRRTQDIALSHNISQDLQDLPKTIHADANALEQVLTNLLSNAVKYSPDAPDIAVSARGEADHVTIEIKDHGLGIDTDDLPNLFSRFFRAKTSLGIAGTGIGLNLVKTLVEMHGGTVSATSEKGEGSTFSIRIPIGRTGVYARSGGPTSEHSDTVDTDLVAS